MNEIVSATRIMVMATGIIKKRVSAQGREHINRASLLSAIIDYAIIV